jgi:hypothetical protein
LDVLSSNPLGCYDMHDNNDALFNTKDGNQVRTVHAMAHHIASGAAPSNVGMLFLSYMFLFFRSILLLLLL